jgi:hypothetical protein
MFLDPDVMLLFLLCVIGFWIGLLLVDFLFPRKGLFEQPVRPVQIQGFALFFPLILTTIMTAVVGVQVFRNTPDLLLLLLSQQGEAIKTQQNSDPVTGILGWASIMQIAIMWWTYWMLSNSVRRTRFRRYCAWSVLYLALLVQLVLCFIRVSRADIMPIIGGFGILFMLGKLRRHELTTSSLFRYMFGFAGAVMCLFLAFGALRGADDLSTGFASFIGYTLASYNRMTAIVHGTMHYPFGGHGLYLSDFIAYNKFFNSIIPIKRYMGWPDYLDLWNADFSAPGRAGLRYDLIWSGTFGYLFDDFGWWTPLVILIFGVVFGFVWRAAKIGSTMGLCLYPWFAFNALCWFVGNLVFGYKFVFFTLAGLSLACYQKLLEMRI